MYPENIYWHLQYFQYANHDWLFSKEIKHLANITLNGLALLLLAFAIQKVITCLREKRINKKCEIAFNAWKRRRRELEEWISKNPYKSLGNEKAQTLIYNELASLRVFIYIKSFTEIPPSTEERNREGWLVETASENFVPSEF